MRKTKRDGDMCNFFSCLGDLAEEMWFEKKRDVIAEAGVDFEWRWFVGDSSLILGEDWMLYRDPVWPDCYLLIGWDKRGRMRGHHLGPIRWPKEGEKCPLCGRTHRRPVHKSRHAKPADLPF